LCADSHANRIEANLFYDNSTAISVTGTGNLIQNNSIQSGPGCGINFGNENAAVYRDNILRYSETAKRRFAEQRMWMRAETSSESLTQVACLQPVEALRARGNLVSRPRASGSMWSLASINAMSSSAGRASSSVSHDAMRFV
jgi:hypothetical protein